MAYLHGAYGEIGESKVASVTQADVVAAYIGTAPVNLIRGYADKDLVNMPVKVTNGRHESVKHGFYKTAARLHAGRRGSDRTQQGREQAHR